MDNAYNLTNIFKTYIGSAAQDVVEFLFTVHRYIILKQKVHDDLDSFEFSGIPYYFFVFQFLLDFCRNVMQTLVVWKKNYHVLRRRKNRTFLIIIIIMVIAQLSYGINRGNTKMEKLFAIY